MNPFNVGQLSDEFFRRIATRVAAKGDLVFNIPGRMEIEGNGHGSRGVGRGDQYDGAQVVGQLTFKPYHGEYTFQVVVNGKPDVYTHARWPFNKIESLNATHLYVEMFETSYAFIPTNQAELGAAIEAAKEAANQFNSNKAKQLDGLPPILTVYGSMAVASKPENFFTRPLYVWASMSEDQTEASFYLSDSRPTYTHDYTSHYKEVSPSDLYQLMNGQAVGRQGGPQYKLERSEVGELSAWMDRMLSIYPISG